MLTQKKTKTMTFERLYNYSTIVSQISFIESKGLPESLKGFDTTKPNVQTNSISKPTEDIAIKRMAIKEEYERLCAERDELEAFIYGISDEFIRAIAIRKFIYSQSYNDIAYAFHTNRNRISDTLKDYIKNCA